MTIIEKAEAMFKPGDRNIQVTGVKPNGTRIKFRLFKTGDGIIGYYAKGKRKRGYRLDGYPLTDITLVEHRKTAKQKWEDGWKKVLSKLQASGLWEEVQTEINTALSIGYDKMKVAYDKYWEATEEAKKVELVKAIDARLVGVNDKGEEYVKSNQVWSYAKLPRVKKMRFHKRQEQNEATLLAIQKAMAEKRTFHANGRTSYDISFEYAPEKGNKAWFSEEFKGCGNGHYFLAISATHSLFVEDD